MRNRICSEFFSKLAFRNDLALSEKKARAITYLSPNLTKAKISAAVYMLLTASRWIDHLLKQTKIRMHALRFPLWSSLRQ